MDMKIVQKSFTFGNSQISFETGRVARQAHGAVLASMDDTQVLVSVVGAKEARAGQSFFPLSVDYIEKTYAAGKIPGGFLKREGRPSEKETLTSRLIDRPIRPLFPNGYMNEVQVMIQVISSNKNVDPDVLAMIATSAALAISGVPFKGPIGAARVGYQDGNYTHFQKTFRLKMATIHYVLKKGENRWPLYIFSEKFSSDLFMKLRGKVYGIISSFGVLTSASFCIGNVSFSITAFFKSRRSKMTSDGPCSSIIRLGELTCKISFISFNIF